MSIFHRRGKLKTPPRFCFPKMRFRLLKTTTLCVRYVIWSMRPFPSILEPGRTSPNYPELLVISKRLNFNLFVFENADNTLTFRFKRVFLKHHFLILPQSCLWTIAFVLKTPDLFKGLQLYLYIDPRGFCESCFNVFKYMSKRNARLWHF